MYTKIFKDHLAGSLCLADKTAVAGSPSGLRLPSQMFLTALTVPDVFSFLWGQFSHQKEFSFLHNTLATIAPTGLLAS